MYVARINCPTELEILLSQWNGLAGGIPFRFWQWGEPWWRHYSSNGPSQGPDWLVRRFRRWELFTLAVFDDKGEMMGLAPWYLDTTGGGGRVIRFLGEGEVCGEYYGVLSWPGKEEEVTNALAEWLLDQANSPSDPLFNPSANGWDLIELNDVDPNDLVTNRLIDKLRERGALASSLPCGECWKLDLPPTWEEYMQTLSKSHRKQMGRLEKRYLENEKLQVHMVRSHEELKQGWEILLQLHERRWRCRGLSGSFSSARFKAFHREVSMRMLEGGALRLFWLEWEGQPISVQYQFGSNKTIYYYQGGMEPLALQHKPGHLATLVTLKQAYRQGYHALDFLRGDEAYKAHWRATPRPKIRYRIWPGRGVDRLRQGFWVAGNNFKDWVKRNLPRGAATQSTQSEKISS